MATLQALVATAAAHWIFNLKIAGNAGWVVLASVLTAVLAVALGLLCSAFATKEFQAVQFMPVVVILQILLCGLFVARDRMNVVLDLEALSITMPMSCTVHGLQEAALPADPTLDLAKDWVVAACVVAELLLASLALRRRGA